MGSCDQFTSIDNGALLLDGGGNGIKEINKTTQIVNADLWQTVLFLHPPQGGPELQLILFDHLL